MNPGHGRSTIRIAAWILGLGILLGTAPPTSARTWQIHVDGSGDAQTVQAGIDSAAAGDTVLVHSGTYFERITFRGRNIVVRSVSGPQATILDATGLGGRVVRVENGESRATVLEGFTVTGGAGGILILKAAPSVIGNVVTGNQALNDGGGIWCDATTLSPPHWSPLIQGNQIVNNQARNLGGGFGAIQGVTPEILDNYIAGNEAHDGDGGGVYYVNFAQTGAIIRGNVIENNRAGDHGGGIYVALAGSPPPALQAEVSWNLVIGNVASGSTITGVSGGGIHLIEANAWVHHNTILGNEGGGTPNTLGGGIGVERVGSPLIEKNIIGLSTQGGGVNCVGGATPILRNNLAWQNTGGDGVGACATWWQSNGNIVADPRFCSAAFGDYSLAENSPAMTHVAGPLGAFHLPGCGPVAVELTTWGRIKSLYSTTGGRRSP